MRVRAGRPRARVKGNRMMRCCPRRKISTRRTRWSSTMKSTTRIMIWTIRRKMISTRTRRTRFNGLWKN